MNARLPAQQEFPQQRSRRVKGNSLIEVLLIVAAAGGLALGIQAFIAKPYSIPSGSMEPTLMVGQRIMVNRVGTRFEGPHVGEIVVFHPPKDAEEEVCGPVLHRVVYGAGACSAPVEEEASVNFVKRIVAGPGDTIFIKGGHVYRNGVREKDPYIRPCRGAEECNFHTPIKIPSGHWFMMGDNRGDSDDSRYWGPVPTAWIIGGVFFTYWPLDRIGLL